MSYRKVSLDITPAQVKKAAAGKTITLSASQLKGSGQTMYVHPSNYAIIQKAKKADRGCRLCIAKGEMDHDVLQGGSLWKFLKDKLWPAIKPSVSAALDAAVVPLGVYTGQPAAVSSGRQLLKSMTGVGVAKGSQAAKDRMAKVRAAKKGGSMKAGSFRLS